MSLMAGQSFAGYEVIAELGHGGMGAVYQARQPSLQRLVALKILPAHLASDQDFIARFQSEAVTAASLNHPNIVQVYAAGESDGIEYIAMEFIEGETIQHRLRRCGRLPLTEALDIAYHIATALDYAWQQAQLIHRDVKPDNIFLAQNGTVKLGDFGLAKILRDGASSVTVTGHVLGSPHFISPEQARGQRDVDLRADIYGLGCTLHYMMTGRTVFEGPDFVSIMYKHVNDPPAPIHTLLPHCPAVVNRLLTRMLAKDREARHQTYTALLEEIVAARDEAATWEESDERQRQRMSVAAAGTGRSRWAYAMAVLCSLFVAAGFVHAKRSGRSRVAANVTTLADASDRRDFIHAVQKLPPLERVERVISKLREVNPGFAGREKYTVEDGMVTELSFSSVGVNNLWPLCALQHLRVLRCDGDAAGKRRGDLRDLSPLAELSELEEVNCSWTDVADLKPLSELHLKVLRCANTRVENLTALKGLPLIELDFAATGVSDLTPLSGMPLQSLRCNETRVRDLRPLRGAPLKDVWCDPRLLRGESEIVKSWTRVETINDLPPREIARRFNTRVAK
jgi:hypothetical protein